MRDTGFKIQDTGFKIQDTGFKIQDTGYNFTGESPERDSPSSNSQASLLKGTRRNKAIDPNSQASLLKGTRRNKAIDLCITASPAANTQDPMQRLA